MRLTRREDEVEGTVETPWPTEVKIGWQVYEIQYLEHKDWPPEYHEAVGITDSQGGLIRIRLSSEDEDYNFCQTQATLLHEILHGVFHVSALTNTIQDDANRGEEHVVLMMTGPLLQVWQDNPEVRDFLADQ